MKVGIDTDQLTIPGYFGNSIHRFFGEPGDVWFTELGERLQACVAKWHLINCQVADNLSVNLICYADSPEYGSVVLKIGFPHPEFYSELAALALYNGDKVCALYDADLDLGAMLLERVLPGYNLKAERDVEERLRVALDIIPNLPKPVEAHPSIPAFADWIDRAFARARREQKMCPVLLTYLYETEAMFYEVTAQEPANYLLHGDLHHENMLYRADDAWVVIDPKGVTGIPSLEAGRYILNAISFAAEGQRRQALEHMVGAFAEAFKRPRRTLAICALVDCVLSRTWTFEEHLTPEVFAREKAESLQLFPLYLDCVKRV